MTSDKQMRFLEVDGIRGWAALSVVCFHIFYETFGVIVPLFRNAVSQIFLDGRMDVAIFFVLSGEALSARYWQNGSLRDVVGLGLRRYSRLTTPILFSCLMVLVLIKLGFAYTHDVSDIIKRPDWMGVFLNSKYTLHSVLRYSFIDVYFNHISSTSPNPFLWTMSIEMLGSIIVFLFILSEQHIKRKYEVLIIAALIFFCAHSFVACFLVGVFYARLRATGWFLFIQQKKNIQWIALPISLTAWVINGYRKEWGLGDELVTITTSSIFLFCVYVCPVYLSLFKSKFSLWLGKISFPLYLVQFPVIVSFTAGSTLWVYHHDKFHAWVIGVVGLTSVVICVITAVLFEPVEILTGKIGRLVSKFLMSATNN